MVIAVLVGVAVGVIAAVYRGRWPEWVANGFSLVGLSVPTFWLGLLAVLYLAVRLRWFPASGYVSPIENPLRGLYYLTLPAVILGTGRGGGAAADPVVDGRDADHRLRAHRPGQGPRRGAGLPATPCATSLIVVVTIVGLQLGGLIAGAVVTERIFGLPGFGKLTLDSVFTRDYPVIQAVVVVITVAYIVINLVVDVLYTVIDPRIRVGGRPDERSSVPADDHRHGGPAGGLVGPGDALRSCGATRWAWSAACCC